MRIETYLDAKDEWRWRALADNNKVVAESGEGYGRDRDMVAALKLVFRGELYIDRSAMVALGTPYAMWLDCADGTRIEVTQRLEGD